MVRRVPVGFGRGLPLRECAVWGNAVGSLCVTRVGTTDGIRNWEETARFIREHTGGLELRPAEGGGQ